MGQNPSKHCDYMQVLKTSFKSSGVEISHSSFKELFSAIEKYCYCHLWGRTESDTTEATWQQQQHVHWGYTVCSYYYTGLKCVNLSIHMRTIWGGCCNFSQGERLRSERDGDLPKATWLATGELGLEAQKSVSQIHPVNFQDVDPVLGVKWWTHSRCVLVSLRILLLIPPL